ncbi:hypothetical protein F2Q70_00038957 [Brassica cretica]|uniref:Uncharacterized protein n=1 Tax=Brassica cretica TaxID=69181 RepID=A0A8S9K4C9_BRACR|nr:hypothetical protein F2Q70_00038957 [Brassica cretica]KAF3494902.1 hypothetical protein DY000_02053354 [Brassica cretica]
MPVYSSMLASRPLFSSAAIEWVKGKAMEESRPSEHITTEWVKGKAMEESRPSEHISSLCFHRSTIHMPVFGEASYCCFLTNLLETTLDDLESPLLCSQRRCGCKREASGIPYQRFSTVNGDMRRLVMPPADNENKILDSKISQNFAILLRELNHYKKTAVF